MFCKLTYPESFFKEPSWLVVLVILTTLQTCPPTLAYYVSMELLIGGYVSNQASIYISSTGSGLVLT
jgi:hypothetical protein